MKIESYLEIHKHNIKKTIQAANTKLNKLRKHKIINRSRIEETEKLIQAQEGQRDILTSAITGNNASGGVVDKNNYKTYTSQIQGMYKMYNGEADYGGEMLRGIVDTRVAFIASEGINVNAENPATKKFIEKWIALNKLSGSKLITMIQTGEMEGKNLVVLQPVTKRILDKDIRYINASSFSWHVNNYNIVKDPSNNDFIKKITYRSKSEIDPGEKSIPPDRAVFVKLGGSEERTKETTNRIHCVLTDIENYSRAKYDLRKNTHLFGKVAPTWKVADYKEALAIRKAVQARSYETGDGYAGTGEMGLLEPSGGAAKQAKEDILISLKTISSTTGIPIHWMAWPELMSNRATAENLLEVINAAIIKEKLIWQESFTEMIQKAMILSIDKGVGEDNDIIGDFTVTLPSLTLATLKALQETWIPLNQAGYISRADVQNRIPGIDPIETDKQLALEKAKAGEESQLNNQTALNILKNQQGEKEDEE